MTKKNEKTVISVFRSSVRSHASHAIGELKNLPVGFTVVTFGLLVVGFTIGESGKTAKKENISNSKVAHLSVLLKQLGILGGQKEI